MDIKLSVWSFRLRMCAIDLRILWLNLVHGWTTEDQRREAFSAGQDAFESEAKNPFQHPVLKEEFDDGVVNAYYCECDMRDMEGEGMEATHAAILRDEMEGIYAECRELELVTSGGPHCKSHRTII